MRYRGAPCGAHLPNTQILTLNERQNYCVAQWCPRKYFNDIDYENKQYCDSGGVSELRMYRVDAQTAA